MVSTGLLSSDTKQNLLQLMKRRGSVSLDDAEAATGLTRTTLREHFGHLERDGLLRRRTKKQGRGRPSLRYDLTERGHMLFPARDGLLLRELLNFLSSSGRTDLVEAFFTTFWDARYDEARKRLSEIDAQDRSGKLRMLEELLREQGFMPEVRSGSDGIVIRECNCPFAAAVTATRLPCRLEARFFERLLDTPASRVAYIPDGSPACTYEFPAVTEDE